MCSKDPFGNEKMQWRSMEPVGTCMFHCNLQWQEPRSHEMFTPMRETTLKTQNTMLQRHTKTKWQQKSWNSSIPVCRATLQMQNTMRLRGSNVIAKTMTRPLQCGAALKMLCSMRLIRRSSVTAKPWNVRSGAQRNPQDAKHNGPEIKRDSKPMKRPFPVHPLRLKMQNTMRLRRASVTAKTMTRPLQCAEQPLRMQNTIRPRRHGKVLNCKMQKIAALHCRESCWHSDDTWKFLLFKSKQDTENAPKVLHLPRQTVKHKSQWHGHDQRRPKDMPAARATI